LTIAKFTQKKFEIKNETGATMDAIDRKILTEIQDNADLSLAELARRVGLSQTPCWKRIQKLEQEGVILKRVALVSPEKIGLGLTVFVSIETGDHSIEWLTHFAAFVAAQPDIL
jgi:Lrp/AsnC family transcriptional regulator